MVCKECGAYNADNLTNCRVCSAALRDGDVSEPEAAREPGRPVRNFAQAPQWPSRSFSQPPLHAEPPKPVEEPDAPEAQPVPAAPVRPAPAAKPASSEKRFCTACGKPLVADAPFCAYCGAKNALLTAAPVAAAADVPAAEEEIRPAAKRPAAPQPLPKEEDYDELDDLEEDDYYDDDDFDDLYDEDDDDFDDDFYDDEFDDDDDDMPRRKGKGGTILFIVLIVVLLALIAFFGTYILKKNYGGSFSNMISSLTGKTTEESVDGEQQGTVVAEKITADNMSATIEETVVDGVEMFVINVKAPTGSRIRIISSADLENDSVEIQRDDAISLRVPRVVFLPEDYYDSTTVTVTPQLEVTLPDSNTRMLDVPSASITVPQVSLVLTEPTVSPIEASADGSPIKVSGTVTDHTVEVTVNGEAVQVLEGGVFSYDYKPTSEAEQAVEIVAKKLNCMSAKQSFVVTPYVIKEMTVAVTSAQTALRATDGKVTVEGTAPAGASITAICENTNIVCGPVTVAEDGKFTCIIDVPKEGCYEINFAAKAPGYSDGAATCTIERMPTSSSSNYKDKSLNANKYYGDLVEGKKDDTQIAFTGKIKEIVTTTPFVIFTMEDSSGNVVYVCNRSDKNTIDNNDIGDKKTIAGFNAGLYPETSNPYIWGWFIWNK